MIPFTTTLEDHLALLLNRHAGDWTKPVLPSIIRPYSIISQAQASSIRATKGYETLCHLDAVIGEDGKENGLYRLWWLSDWRDHYANIQASKAQDEINRVK